MARVCSYLTPDRQSDYALLAFPEKLWWIVNNPKREEIHWNALGTGIVIPNIQRFISEVLNSPSSGIFKTKHFASFMRQLNLYGFRKVTEYGKRAMTSSPFSSLSKCEFKHPYFQKGRQDLLVHVRRQLCSSKKPDNKRQKNCIASSSETQVNQLPGSTSVSASWNPTLYTPVPFVPLQTSLQMPFTLYAPFYNAYYMAQIQQRPVVGLPNAQGIGLAEQFPQSPPSPALTLAQSLGYCGENMKSVSSSVSIQNETRNAGIVSSYGNLPVENVENLTSPLSPSAIKSTATAVPVLATNTVIHGNASNPEVITECKETSNGFSQGQAHVRRAYDTKFAAAADKNSMSTQKSAHSLRREPAEPSGSCRHSQSFTVHAILKESAVKRFVAGSQSLLPKGNGECSSSDGNARSNQRPVCNEKVVVRGTEFSKEFANI